MFLLAFAINARVALRYALLPAAIALFVLSPAAAFAQAAAEPAPLATWSPGPLYLAAQPYIMAILSGVVLPAALAFVGYVMKAKFNLELSESARKQIQEATTNAAGRLMASQNEKMATAVISINSPLIAREVPRVTAAVNAAVKHFDLTPENVAEMIQGKVGLLQAQAQSVSPVVEIAAKTADATKLKD